MKDHNPSKDRKKKRFLNQEDKDKICRLYLEGVKCEEIGVIMNSDPSWIVKITKKAGVWKEKIERYKDVGRSLTLEQENILKDLHFKGLNHREVSEEMGLTYDSIAKTSRRLGLEGYVRKYQLDEDWLNEINSPEKAIYLGLFFSDGCNVKTTPACAIYLNENDRDYLERIKNFFTNAPLLKRRMKKYKDRCRCDQRGISVSSIKWTNNLHKYGAVPAKSLILEWPKLLPEKLTKYFIRGFFEGDGGICVSKRSSIPYYTICITSTKEFLEDCSSQIWDSLNIKTFMYKARKTDDKNTYTLNISRQKDVKSFLDWIYEDLQELAMDRKFQLYQNLLRDRFPESLLV